MNKEEMMLRKRFIDLSNISFRRNIPMFTDFLSMNELSILHTTKANEFAAKFYTYGGYDFAERQMAMFVPDALFYEVDYPISVLNISPKYPKFAQKIEHRDCLGALIHLGIDRSKIGDIIVNENDIYFFCDEKLADFFCEQLVQIKHTSVITSVSDLPKNISKPEMIDMQGTVSSLRIDNIVAFATRKSRNSIIELFKSQKIFINGKLNESVNTTVKENDIITVRGFGRFIFDGVINVTKKDRLLINVKKMK